jgi:hypothetical protein
MNILVVISPSHNHLYEQHFLKTLPQGVSVIEHRLVANGDGAYLSKGWQSGVVRKLEVVLAYAKLHSDEVFILSDIDIQFFPTFKIEDVVKDFNQAGVDVLFQRESLRADFQEVNTGFYIARSTPYVIKLLEEALAICAKNSSIHHANRTLTTYNKAIQLRRVRKLIMGGMLCRHIAISEEILEYVKSGEVFAMLWRRMAARLNKFRKFLMSI